MARAKKSYWLLSETSGVEETFNPERQRHLPAAAAFGWLRAGWRDLFIRPGPSLAYGVAVFIVSALLVWALVSLWERKPARLLAISSWKKRNTAIVTTCMYTCSW